MKTYLPLFRGFYGSHWDEPYFDGEEDHYDLPSDKYFDDFVDWEKYHDHIAKGMCNYLESELSDFVSSIQFECVASPKYYNFENDAIHCDIEFDKEKIQAYLDDNRQAFADYVKEHYTSGPGFISYYSHDSKDWDWSTDSHMLGSVLNFICINEGIEEPFDIQDSHISLFYTENINEYSINA